MYIAPSRRPENHLSKQGRDILLGNGTHIREEHKKHLKTFYPVNVLSFPINRKQMTLYLHFFKFNIVNLF